MGIGELVRVLKFEVTQWCRGRSGLVRLPLLAGFLYIFIRHLINPEYSSILGGLNLGIHELGHYLFMFFPDFMQILGGTFWETAAPLIGMWNFYRQEDYFAITLCFGWLSTALFDIARYAGDARAMVIPLVAPFGGSEEGTHHDWNYMLGQMGILEYDHIVAGIFRVGAVVAMLVCLITGGWLVWCMMVSGGEKKEGVIT